MRTEIKIRLGLGEDKEWKTTQEVNLTQYQTNQVTHLFIDRFLEFIPVEHIMEALSVWKTKLRHGASLIITGTDICQIGKAILTKTLKIPEINKILFGTGNRCCLSLEDVVSLLEHLELKIITKRISDNFTYTIIAERP